MGLTVAGHHQAALKGFDWLANNQREDGAGSRPIRTVPSPMTPARKPTLSPTWRRGSGTIT